MSCLTCQRINKCHEERTWAIGKATEAHKAFLDGHTYVGNEAMELLIKKMVEINLQLTERCL